MIYVGSILQDFPMHLWLAYSYIGFPSPNNRSDLTCDVIFLVAQDGNFRILVSYIDDMALYYHKDCINVRVPKILLLCVSPLSNTYTFLFCNSFSDLYFYILLV